MERGEAVIVKMTEDEVRRAVCDWLGNNSFDAHPGAKLFEKCVEEVRNHSAKFKS